MSLFGQTQQQSGGLFGSATPTANKPSPFGGFGATTTTTTTTAGTQQTPGGGLFGGAPTQQPAAGGGGLFGSNATSQPQQTGGLFGSTTTTQNQPQAGGGLFGSTAQQTPQGGGLFGGGLGQTQTQQPQQAAAGGGGLFGSTLGQQKPQGGGLFGGLGQQQQQQQPQQQGGGLFGGLGATTQQPQQQPQQQGGLFGGSLLGGQQQQQQAQQQQQQQQSQLGQTTTHQPGSSLWSPGRAVTGVHRTVPMQIEILKNKWDTGTRASPFRSYLYNYVTEDSAPFFQPTAEDDDTKWEEALRKRPGPGYVPVLVRGFWELGKRAQRQKDFLTMAQTRLHEINNCLTDLLSRHDLKISVKIADCRRKHLVLSKRCLALAAKTQVLRNRGYAMDEAEEELRKKLSQLERSVFDPSLNGRAEEIWARMLAIREHSKRLQAEMERAGATTAAQAEDELDENTMKTTKKILADYHAQIEHLHKELQSVKKDFEEAEKLLQGTASH
ncbi:putative nucleoporin [Aspergillus clavatus NRRL 1]|uniref:Nucleoporin, putative n=1 Tax=Aspergillus clavatus (strain ATCC 1007 / CBS 513.65 / DSM 816 / NCTC 3887 / NRRL 1 / QM 1276 / 107) TaxID=344612 RepID=A1CPN3_ASPCL|nr:nucleoporin, putative [Aspergillus clavatus NRRL 1]EAW07604.1 nucleoporin, putative [Aspergillus clavatus NRRL 1]